MEEQLDKAVTCISVSSNGWMGRFGEIVRHVFPLRNGGRRMVVMLLVGKLRREMVRLGVEDGGEMIKVLEEMQEKYGAVEIEELGEDGEEEENMSIEDFLKKMMKIDLDFLPHVLPTLYEEEVGEDTREEKEGKVRIESEETKKKCDGAWVEGEGDMRQRRVRRREQEAHDFLEKLKVADDILSFLSTVIFLSIRILF
jgi:hypothetical protein